jgi:hypothetical protein
MNHFLKPHQIALAAMLFLNSASLSFGAEPKAKDLLAESDRSRGSSAVSTGVSWRVKVDTIGGDSSSNTITYDLKVKGDDALAEALEPARNKGEVMLFNNRNIWFFKPSLKKPVAISPRQKLMGQASNGDIASTNYARDYDGKIVGSESINGESSWKLDLKAIEKNVTYDRIIYWIRKKDRLGIKAEFQTVSGKPFKLATFEYKNKLKSDGKEFDFISKMVIIDADNPKNITTLVYTKPAPDKHADSLFNVNNLVR